MTINVGEMGLDDHFAGGASKEFFCHAVFPEDVAVSGGICIRHGAVALSIGSCDMRSIEQIIYARSSSCMLSLISRGWTIVISKDTINMNVVK